MSEIVEVRIADLEVAALPETQQIAFTHLPTGARAVLSVEAANEYLGQLLDAFRGLEGHTDRFQRLEASFLRHRALLRHARTAS